MIMRELRGMPYLPGLSVAEYLDWTRKRFPELAKTLWLDRPGSSDALSLLAEHTNEFEDDTDTGRGTSYRRAQKNRMVRAWGIRALFTLAAGVATVAHIPRDWRLLDMLGGDGLLAHVLRSVAPQVQNAAITSDMAGTMVLEALRKDLPAIRQFAQFLFMRDKTMDAAILAYGTHHIASEERPVACREAARVLRPGGRLVLHDFEDGSPAALWFSEVVHRYSRSGHPYTHFTVAEMKDCLRYSGLRPVGVGRVYDPLIIRGDDPAEVRSLIADYLFDMYGLVGIVEQAPRTEIRQIVWKLAKKYFVYRDSNAPEDVETRWKREPVVYRENSTWVAEVPRVALVAIGEK